MAAKLSTLLIKSVQLLGFCPQTSTRGSALGPRFHTPETVSPMLTENLLDRPFVAEVTALETDD